ncbi:MAG: sigma-70 family RNA polymerase sigma factor [Polyangiaceae bacterium]
MAIASAWALSGSSLPPALGRWYFAPVNRRTGIDERTGVDAALMRRVARGDRAALAELYDAHAPAVYGVIRRIVRTDAEAEDVSHDVFVEAWRRASDYEPTRGSVRAWLVIRARSRALDHVKSAAVSRTDVVSDLASTQDSPDSGLTRASDGRRLLEALGALPEEQREVLFLGYFQGLSSSEIAEAMGTPVGTVKSRVATALSRLRQALGDPGKDPGR